MGNRELLALFSVQRAVQGQGDHAEQAVQGRTDLMAHVGQERRARLGHIQCGAACHFQFFVGLAQPRIAGLELGGAGRDDIFQLAQIVGQAIFGVAPLLYLGAHVFELLIGNPDQHANFIVFVAGRECQPRLFRLAWSATAECLDHPRQGFGQHHIEQHQEDNSEDQAADKTVDQSDLGPMQEADAEGIGIDIQEQGAQWFVRQMAEKKPVFEALIGAEQPIADHPITALLARPFHAGQDHVVVVDQLRAQYGGRAQQTLGQYLGQFGVDVVGDPRCRVVADFQQGEDFTVDRGAFAGIINPDLQQTEQYSQNETDQYRQPGLFVGQAVGEFYIHGLVYHFPFPSPGKHS